VTTHLLGDPPIPPEKVESIMLDTADGHRIEAWRYPSSAAPARVAIVLHGNGGTVGMFFPFQRWLEKLGFTSYDLDYRSYGRSSGWPSETAEDDDIEMLAQYAASREKVGVESIVVVGNSIGSGLAAHLAAVHHAPALVLFAPYTSIPDIVDETPLFSWLPLKGFLKWKMPTREYVEALGATCLLLAHGARDGVIPPHHSEELLRAYRGTGAHILAVSESAGHNEIFYAAGKKIGEELLHCLAQPASGELRRIVLP
jgi:pimeloyl-ACP methyl ester carboxylesterase